MFDGLGLMTEKNVCHYEVRDQSCDCLTPPDGGGGGGGCIPLVSGRWLGRSEMCVTVHMVPAGESGRDWRALRSTQVLE